jgi:hypothetical protein
MAPSALHCRCSSPEGPVQLVHLYFSATGSEEKKHVPCSLSVFPVCPTAILNHSAVASRQRSLDSPVAVPDPGGASSGKNLHQEDGWSALHCTALHCTALHCTALHCTALHCTALHCTALHCTARHKDIKVLFETENMANIIYKNRQGWVPKNCIVIDDIPAYCGNMSKHEAEEKLALAPDNACRDKCTIETSSDTKVHIISIL